jgi:tetratricopeptide (TPR) repeat protein
MHEPMIRSALAGTMFGALLLAVGCGGSPSPEQLAADSTLVAARTALDGGDHEQARKSFRVLLGIEEKLGRAAPQAEATRGLARIAVARAEFDSALALYARSRELYRRLADRESVRKTTIEVASLHRLMGEEDEAFTLLEESLRLARVFGDSAGVCEIELAILPSCRLLDQRDVESRVVNDLLKTFGGVKATGELARVYEEVGKTQLFRHEYSRAAEHFLQEFTLADKRGDSLRAAEALVNVGIALAEAGRTSEAFQSYGDALRRTDRLRGASLIRSDLLLRVGNAYARTKQFEQAKRFYAPALTAALRGKNKLAEGYLALQMALCDLDRNPDEALRNIRNVVELFRGSGSSRASSYALLCLGYAQEHANRLTDAIQAYRGSVDELESTRAYQEDDLYAECERTFFPQLRGAPYHQLLDALFRTGQYEQGFLYAQRKQSWDRRRIFDRQELHRQADPVAPLLPELRRAVAARTGAERQIEHVLETAYTDRILGASIRTALEKSKLAIATRSEEIVRGNSIYEPFVRLTPVGFAEIQKRMHAGDALLWYVAARRSLYALVVTPSRVSVGLAAMEREHLQGLLGEVESSLQRAEAKGDTISKVTVVPDFRTQEVLRQLYEAFLRPIEGEIAGAMRIQVVLPHELASVPVHALRRNTLPGTLFLAEMKTVSYLPGPQWMRPQGLDSAAVKTVAGLGFAGTTAWDVEYELRDIRAFFKEARLAFGQQATLEWLQQEKADVLHLALGIRYSDRSPWNAALVLSDGKSSATRTLVPLGELLTLHAVPTVVFSGLMPDQPRIPALIAPLLLSSGSRFVITTAYTPSRKLKKFFGESFYTALASGATPEQAFRKAQRDMIRSLEFSSPLVWSSYALWGR